MSTAYVIHAEEDRAFIEQHVLRILPSSGYLWWVSRQDLPIATQADGTYDEVLNACEVVLVVLSETLLASRSAVREIELALGSRRPVIAVQRGTLDHYDTGVLNAIRAVPVVDFTIEEQGEGLRLLAGLLPPVRREERGAIAPQGAKRISWNEDIFSASLVQATSRHDHARAESLVEALIAHLRHAPYAYPAKEAYQDLQELREEREFVLMKRYAQAVIGAGTTKDRVRRLFAQALIETKEYRRALDVLQSIIDDEESSGNEVFEAYGLIGRTYKQRYANAPKADGAGELLMRAIAAYERVYRADTQHFWHGVNAASCMLRAERDGILTGGRDRAREIAQQIAQDLERLAQKSPLAVWDCASRAEALVALERYDDAERAIGVYINHPDMRAFEVFSTYRQFEQILQLDREPRGKAIWSRLRQAVERYRAGTIVAEGGEIGRSLAVPMETSPVSRSLVIRVGDPAWQPRDDVPDLLIQSRLGKIVTASGSDASVRALLNDSMVTAVENSRPAGMVECDRSIPFIKAAPEYASAAGNYKETGDRALIAIVDDGIDVLHHAFLDGGGHSRLVGIWDQADPSGAPPAPFTYGTFHDAAAIAQYVANRQVPAGLGRNPSGHGTHVGSIAGGRATSQFAGGAAPDAKLLIVVSAATGPIGYSTTHIDALAFIDAFALKLNLPVVVNLSQGMNAGAHDGKSSLEAAFDAFAQSGRKEGRVVVKSAGNERAKDGHARVTVLPDTLEELRWKRTAGAAMTERIELWWSSANDLEFRLRDPFKKWSAWVRTASPDVPGTFVEGGPYHLLFTKRHVDNGDSLLEIELGNTATQAALGEWLLEIRSNAVSEEGEVHCWIERTPGTPTRFLDHVHEDMTLSIPATAASVIAVGAVAASRPLKVGAFSSYGPTRDGQKKPLVCAPGVDVNAADGGTDEDIRMDSGTSMAAPHVTGAIALLLSRTAKAGRLLSANQIAAALRQKTQNYNGRWDRGQGYGVIDVTALLGAF